MEKGKKVIFRGQEALLFKGGEKSIDPHRKSGRYIYGIRHHQTETNIPLHVERLVVWNRWGTLITPEPLLMDRKNADQKNCDFTDLTLDEAKLFMEMDQAVV